MTEQGGGVQMNITNLEMTQATIEIFAGAICLMLAVIVLMNGHERKCWRLLKWMLFSMAVIFFAEACAYIFRGNTDRIGVFMTRSMNFIVFLFNIILIVLFMQYIYELLTEKGLKPGSFYKHLVTICVLVSLMILVVNLFTGWMYYFDEGNLYHRNTGWYIYAVLNTICILSASVMSIRYRKSFRKLMLAALLVYTFAPVIAIVLQTFFYGISITNIGIFIAMVFMVLVYLREWSRAEEHIEKERKSLEIIILFVIMTISMCSSIFSCIVSINRISNDNSESNSMLIAHMISDNIENEFIRPIVVSETMANDYSLKQYMKESVKDEPKAVEGRVAAYLNSIRTGFGYHMVFAVCDKSNTYYTYNGISKYVDAENDPHDIWYKEFLKERKPYDLDVDTDEANNWALSVFVNREILDENGDFLGVCGVGVEMTQLQRLLNSYEAKYHVKIDLVDENGLIQVDSDAERIERDYIDTDILKKAGSEEFYYENLSDTSRMTKYMENLGWYLVVEDRNPDKINVMEVTATSIVIFMIGFLMMVIVFSVISIRERKASRELIERKKIAITDEMTGLFNRRAYEEDCIKILESDAVRKTVIIMMDVNGLKTANDTYGHLAGDELIIGAANCIQTALGEYGKVYRTGGDEFVALLECTKEQLDDMLQTFAHITERWKGDYKCSLSISKGVVVCAEHENLTFDEMKDLADKLMYEDKEAYYRKTGVERRKMPGAEQQKRV